MKNNEFLQNVQNQVIIDGGKEKENRIVDNLNNSVFGVMIHLSMFAVMYVQCLL